MLKPAVLPSGALYFGAFSAAFASSLDSLMPIVINHPSQGRKPPGGIICLLSKKMLMLNILRSTSAFDFDKLPS